MKLLSYNLRDGAQANYDTLIEFINGLQPDIVCFQEANEWQVGTPSRIEDFADRTGLTKWQFGDSKTPFKLLTYSQLPIIESANFTDGFWHSAVKITVLLDNQPLTIWNVHFDPREEANRLKEAKQLLTLAVPYERTFIVGDINSISRIDNYAPELLDELKTKGILKFGNKELLFDTTDYIKTKGFVDIAAHHGILESTVPTLANNDPDHAHKLRLDYIFATADMAPLVTELSITKDRSTDIISDHYPIVAIIE